MYGKKLFMNCIFIAVHIFYPSVILIIPSQKNSLVYIFQKIKNSKNCRERDREFIATKVMQDCSVSTLMSISKMTKLEILNFQFYVILRNYSYKSPIR